MHVSHDEVLTQTAGVTNGGYWGVNIAPHGIYRVSMYLKAAHDTVRRLLRHPHPALVRPACVQLMMLTPLKMPCSLPSHAWRL